MTLKLIFEWLLHFTIDQNFRLLFVGVKGFRASLFFNCLRVLGKPILIQ
jgi:hypothetical protein